MTNRPNILSIRDVSRSFGGIKAINHCSMEIEEGKITGIIGPNGAGKSTLISVICGILRPDSGRIIFDDQDITGWHPARIAQRGLARTFQIARPLPDVPLIENVIIGHMHQRGESFWKALVPGLWKKEEEALRQRAADLLHEVRLGERREGAGYALSGGEQKLLEFTRAKMAMPKLLLLDEPIAGVNPRLIGEMADYVLAMKQASMTIVVVEHNLRFVDQICDKVIVMAEGTVLVQGSMEEIRHNEDVIRVYLGGSSHVAG